jgi:hypothetical protein
MFSDRINWIDLILFSRLPDEAEETQFRFSGKKSRGANNGRFSPCFTVLLVQ